MLTYSDLESTIIEDLTLAWNSCWQGYAYETQYSEAQMKAWLEKCQIDLSQSVALKKSDRIIGFSLLALENKLGWIAGTCINPEFRGQHLFEPLLKYQLKKADSLILKGIQLEVLTQNHAIKVYEKIGFRKTRELYVYRHTKDALSAFAPRSRGGSVFREAILSDYFHARNESGFTPPWQRREEYLQRYPSLIARLNPEGTAGVLMTKEGQVLLDAWTMAWEQVDKLVSAILTMTQGDFRLTNQPKDCLTGYLSQHGLEADDIQYEMRYS
ncbi:acetyltransferase [Desulfitobacterium dichloroeliminans LMG P-21439]|uniref:Acetyltransferase n=1 Tax=Desulfitobacterium dichloroeliminans (strain LMG P-21439 / DCA1) TaxID=871963 RepID=L0F8V3_DESDL|nr:GNAT family N-acetyltransferase [Desulfitobacterium dichloroeliminans]AGA69388.1 acetyltransferase [Desulfitobacterium dichloroeliminans LMG P-21439]